MAFFGFGIPNWPRSGPPTYDWWPLVLPVVAILAAAWPFRVRLTRRSVLALALGGTLTAWLIQPVGVVPAVALGIMALSVSSTVARRGARPGRD